MYEGKLVRLRALRPEDAEKAVIWLNDLETVQQISGGMALPVSLESEKKWVERHLEQDPDKGYTFAVETLDGEYIGNCDYFDLNWHDRTCKVGWLIGPEGRGKGYGTTFFSELRQRYPSAARFRLEVEPDNDGAKALYSRMGYEALNYGQMVLDIS